VALNDEGVAVRATAVRLVGRLAGWNPAYVAPALRRHLLQLLTDMEHSPDSRWVGGFWTLGLSSIGLKREEGG